MDKDLHIGVSVLVFNNKGQVLLGKRIGVIGGGMYQAAGGHAEPNESFEHTANREVYEETGLECHNLQFLCYQDNYYAVKGKWYRTFFYTALADYPENEPVNKEPDKCEGWAWYDFENLPEPLFEWNEYMRCLAEKRYKDLFGFRNLK